MTENHDEYGARPKGARTVPIVSAIWENGTIVETVYRPQESRTALVIWKNDAWHYQVEPVELSPGRIAVPYSPYNNLLRNNVVLLPSEPEEYGSEASLLAEIQAFIHRYVDVSPLFEKIASYYVLLSWIYDGFNELPYLRLRGDPGSGKTRFLLIVGSLCYKPMFASGASTVSPLFRILDTFRGTLIIDEADFRLSDERAEIVKILNNGNARGFPVLRSEATPTREFNPRAYAVFGPKLVATRRPFEDRALESRCITEEMGQYKLREDVPINLPAAHKDEALHLRNKLLLFRFRNLHKRKPNENLVDRSIEPRLNQIFVPLLSIVDDGEARAELRALARRYDREMVTERGMDMEAQILEIIREMVALPDQHLSIKEIASWFSDRHGTDYQRPVTPKWIGSVIRTRLQLRTRKSDGVFIIPREEMPKLVRLYEKYGLAREGAEEGNGGSTTAPSPAAVDGLQGVQGLL
ncbi:MAG: hypothetical protein HYR85_18680 [Planctomycetes bacterium]|nr:hypothetical protein [Planctomycetota bacterium]MBI3825627.1 hypothetical protein [Candidatus Rokubacteria bacterium]